jgi:hypothetical protein
MDSSLGEGGADLLGAICRLVMSIVAEKEYLEGGLFRRCILRMDWLREA